MNLNIFGTTIVVLMISFACYIIFRQYKEGKKGEELLRNFESRMKKRGFTRRIVVYDFLSESAKSKEALFEHRWTVGIWLSYQNQLVALRLDRDSQDEIDIPFDKIQSVEIIGDGHAVTTGGAFVYGEFAVGRAKTKEINKGLQVRIVAGDIKSGTNAYYLNLYVYDPEYGSKLNKSDVNYRAIHECARSIADEINNIMLHV